MTSAPLSRLYRSAVSAAARPPSLRLERVVMGAWILSLMLAMLVPVYSDEVGWRLQERAGLDGVDKSYAEQCGPQSLAMPPWFMWPVRWYSAFFNTAFPTPFWTRASGVAYALVWTGMALVMIRVMTSDPAWRRACTLLLFALMGLGTLPLQMVWSRPEQPLLLALTAAMTLAWRGWNLPVASLPEPPAAGLTPTGPTSTGLMATGPATAVRIAAILALAAFALSYHFKALLVWPIFIACVALAGREKSTHAVRAAGIGMLLLLAWQGAHYWFGRFACPGDALITAQHARQTLMLDWSAGPLTSVWQMISNFNVPAYVTLAAPNVTPMSDWLLPHLVTRSEQFLWRVAMLVLWLTVVIMAILSGAGAARRLWQRREMDLRLGFAILLLGAVSAWAMAQKVRNSYEAAFVLPMLALACVSIFAMPGTKIKYLNRMVRFLAVAMLVSQLLVAAIYGPSLLAAARRGGVVAGQPLSLSVAPFGPTRDAIIATARLCHLDPATRPARLLIDDLTYYPFMTSPLPDHQISVLNTEWNGMIGHDPLPYLRANHAGGMVVQCSNLSADLRKRAHESGGFCCMAPADWQK